MRKEARERLLLSLFGGFTAVAGIIVLLTHQLPNALQIFGGLLLLSTGLAVASVLILPDLRQRPSSALLRSERATLVPVTVLFGALFVAALFARGLPLLLRVVLAPLGAGTVLIVGAMVLSGRVPLAKLLDDILTGGRQPASRDGGGEPAPPPPSSGDRPRTYDERVRR